MKAMLAPRTPYVIASAMIVLFGVGGTAEGQLPVPQLRAISPLGGQAGATFELTIAGEDLDDVRELRFSHAGVTAEPKMTEPQPFEDEPRPAPNAFLVRIAEGVPPGLYEVRAVGYFGVSNPRVLAVDQQREATLSGPATDIEEAAELEIGSVVSAVATPERVHYYKVRVPGGRNVLVECFAERLDSQMDATLVLYDGSGRELRRVRDTIGRDPVLLVSSEEEREYVFGVFDFTYRGGNEHFYRLAVHTQPRLLYAYPPVVTAGDGPREIALFGWNLPGGERVADSLSLAEAPLERVTVQASIDGPIEVPPAGDVRAAFAAGVPYRLDTPSGPTNPVYVQTAPHPVAVEREGGEEAERPHAVSVPGEFVGRLDGEGKADWVEFTGNRGDVLHLDVIAHRMGVPADAVLTVHKLSVLPDGSTRLVQVASADDSPYGRDQRFDLSTSDPFVRIAVDEPAIYRAAVRDLYGNPANDPRLVYRLSVRRESPDFQLTAVAEPPRATDNQPLPASGLCLRRGGTAAVVVGAQRLGGFEGPIEVVARDLPSGVHCRPALIRPGEARATLVLAADDGAQAGASRIAVVGRAETPTGTIERSAVIGTTVWSTPNPNAPVAARLSSGMDVAVSSAPPAPATVIMGDDSGESAPLEPVVVKTSVGANAKIPLRVTRREGFAGDMNLAAVGLVDGMQLSPPAIKGDQSEAEAELAVTKADFKPGTYEVHVRSRVRANLPRNPDAIALAESRQVRMESLLEAKASEAEQLASARDATRAAAQTAKCEHSAREAELADAKQQADEAVARQAEQSQQLAAARSGVATTATLVDVSAMLDAAQAGLVTAIEAAREARARLVQLEAQYAAAQAAAEVADTRLEFIERELQAVEQDKQRLTQLRDAANAQLEEAKKTHGPKDYEFEVISQPVRVIVEEARPKE